MIQDGVAERRNLVVMSLAIMVYYWAGGEILVDEARLLLVSVKFHNPTVLFIFVWVLFIYFIFRYRVTSKVFDDGTVRHNMSRELSAFPIRKKHYQYLAEAHNASRDNRIPTLEFRVCFLKYLSNKIVFTGTLKSNGSIWDTPVKGFHSRRIVFETLVRGYVNLANVNAYYTPYMLAFVALVTLSYNTYLKYCH